MTMPGPEDETREYRSEPQDRAHATPVGSANRIPVGGLRLTNIRDLWRGRNLWACAGSDARIYLAGACRVIERGECAGVPWQSHALAARTAIKHWNLKPERLPKPIRDV